MRKNVKIWTHGLAASLVTFAVLSACTYRGAIDNSATWKVTWYSYISADDIRRSCVSGAPLHYRFIYNADYESHIRSYEVVADGAGGAYQISRAISGSGVDITALELSDPFAIGGRWERGEHRLSPVQLASLKASLRDSGVFGGAPVGLRLYSNQYFWVAALCDDGEFYFDAWLYPSKEFEAISFPEFLFTGDNLALAAPPPRRVPSAGRLRGDRRGEKPNPIFELRVGEDGFQGAPIF